MQKIKNKVTALMTACKKGNEDAINVLLNIGTDSNIADAVGNTSLHYAARNNCCTEVLQAIISHGADVNAKNKKNITALMIACQRGNTDGINVLLCWISCKHFFRVYNGNTLLHAVLGGCNKKDLSQCN